MVEECPDPVAEWLASLPVTVRDLPSSDSLQSADGPVSPLRHCRFEGEPGDGPFGEDPERWLDAVPTNVLLYRRNIGKTAHDEYELRREVFEAVLWETMDFLCLEEEHLVRLGVLEADDDD
jgi:predicted Zn-dependent protease with MMP-like domain